MDFKKLICHTTELSFETFKARGKIHRPCANISKKPCTLAVVLWGLFVDVGVWLCWLGTDEETEEFEFGGCFVETCVVGGGVDLDGILLLSGEGDWGWPDRCNLLEDPDGEGRRGIAGVTDAGLPMFVFVVIVSVSKD